MLISPFRSVCALKLKSRKSRYISFISASLTNVASSQVHHPINLPSLFPAISAIMLSSSALWGRNVITISRTVGFKSVLEWSLFLIGGLQWHCQCWSFGFFWIFFLFFDKEKLNDHFFGSFFEIKKTTNRCYGDY